MPHEIRPNGSLVVTVRMTLQPGRDDDLIALVQMAPRGRLAAMVREAMRSGTSTQKSTFYCEAEEAQMDLSNLALEI